MSALDWLENTQAANPRIWGIQEEIDRVKAIRDEALDLKQRAIDLLNQDHATAAYPLLKRAQQLVSDDSHLNGLKTDTKGRIAQAHQEFQTAVEYCNVGNAPRALEHARSAAQLDATDKHVGLAAEIAGDIRCIKKSAKWNRFGILASLTAGVATLLLVAGLIWLSQHNATIEAEQDAIVSAASDLVYAAHANIQVEAYVAAKSKLEDARRQLTGIDTPDASDVASKVDEALASEEIIQGASGKVPLDGQWVSREDRERELNDREQLRVQVASLKQQIDDFLSARLKPAAHISDAEQTRFQELATQIREVERKIAISRFDEARTAHATLVEKWQSLLRQSGLVKYQEQWMTSEAAEEAELAAKGLVKWITKEEKERIEMAETIVEEAEEDSRFERDLRIDKTRESLMRAAYRISQEFVEDHHRALRGAEFPDFDDDDVRVVFKDNGNYFVSAEALPKHTFIHHEYEVEVRPLDAQGIKWQRVGPVNIFGYDNP